MATALRGHIHWHDYGPVTGAELSGNRPALVVSNNLLNQRLTTAITLPTSKSEPHQRFRRQHVWLNESESYASARQIKSVAQEGLGDLIGRASDQELEHIITSITERLQSQQRAGRMDTPQGPRLLQRGTVLQEPERAQQDEDANDFLVLDYNAGNHMAVVVDLEYRRRNIESPVAVPIRIDGEASPGVPEEKHRVPSGSANQDLRRGQTSLSTGPQDTIPRHDPTRIHADSNGRQ